MFAEYYLDSANGNIPTWKMVRTDTVKYIQTYNAERGGHLPRVLQPRGRPGREHQPPGDGNTANDPPASTVSNLTSRLNSFATCAGANCIQ